jgi:hypothetical protein
MKSQLSELEARRKALVNYSDVQRTLVANNLAVLKRPLVRLDGVGDLIKTHPLAALMSAGGVFLGGLVAKKMARFSLGAWIGRKLFNVVRRQVFR